MPVRVGLALPQLGVNVTTEVVRDFVVAAEELGYASLWAQDHFLYPLGPERGYGGQDGVDIPSQYRSVFSPIELLTVAATLTERIRIGTSVLVAGHHWPVPLANRLATLDVLSDGRLDVGLGVGWSPEEHTANGTDVTTRGRRMDDFVPALKACWGPDPVTHDGPFFTVPDSLVRPKPVQSPHPPLLAGMWSPAGRDRCVRHFDGWHPAGMPVPLAADLLAEMNARRAPDQRPLTIHHKVLLEWPGQPPDAGEAVDRMVAEVATAAAAGFDEVVLDHSFWSEIRAPSDWAAVPERFAAVLTA